jgi:hypothetical protein
MSTVSPGWTTALALEMVRQAAVGDFPLWLSLPELTLT